MKITHPNGFIRSRFWQHKWHVAETESPKEPTETHIYSKCPAGSFLQTNIEKAEIIDSADCCCKCLRIAGGEIEKEDTAMHRATKSVHS
jgi:hypothetical protein